MPHREHAPTGSPCWADLWTSDVEGSRRFYGGLFGWEADEPNPEFGGYFMFTRNGVPTAGAMGDMGDTAEMQANDTWKIYLATDDMAKTIEAAEVAGAQIVVPGMEVGDAGIQAVLIDPTGAEVGAWQEREFPGFTVLNEHGAPSWCELHTRDHPGAVDFYRSVFHWETSSVADTDESRYTTMTDPTRDGDLAGIMDAKSFLPPATASFWSIYWEVDDADAAVTRVKALGGSVVMDIEDTPYGRLATVADPAGAQFKLRQVTS